MPFPPVRVVGCSASRAPREYSILIREVPAVSGILDDGLPGELGARLTGELRDVLSSRADELLGIQEVSNLINALRVEHPALIDETIPKIVSLATLTEALRCLLREGISIGDLRGILEAVALCRPGEDDPSSLTEHLRRSALRRRIFHKYARGQRWVSAVVLSRGLEDQLCEIVEQAPSGPNYLPVHPDTHANLLAEISEQLSSTSGGAAPVLLTSRVLRPHLRRLIQLDHPELPVLSYQELPPEALIHPCGSIPR